MNLLKKEAVLVLMILIALPIVISLDSDKDGLDDNSDIYPNDFDNDGMPDSWEMRNGLKYDLVTDASLDNDNDGISNLDEFNKGTDPNSADSDGDGDNDYTEIINSTDPLVKETTIWPLAFIPILIIVFIFFLYLFEKYHLDEKLKSAFSKKNEQINNLMLKEQTQHYPKPEIEIKSISQIRNEKEQLKRSRANIINIFGANNRR